MAWWWTSIASIHSSLFHRVQEGKKEKKKKSTKRIICVVLSTNFLIYSSVSPNPVSLIRYHRTKWHYQNPSPNKIQPSKPVFAHGMWWVQQRCKTDFVWAAFHGQSQDLAWLFGLRWECSVRGNAYVMWQPVSFCSVSQLLSLLL